MPSFQSIVLTDRTTPTAVNKTFTPYTKDNGVATVIHAPAGIMTGAQKLSISTRRVNGKLKTRVLFACPVVQTETINGIARPVVVRDAYVDATFTFDASSTEVERNDVVGMFGSALTPAKALVHDTIVKGENVYGG